MKNNEITQAIKKIREKEGYLDQADEYFLITEIQSGNDLAFEVLEEKFADYLDRYATHYLNTWNVKSSRCPKITISISLADLKKEARKALWSAAMTMDFSQNTRLSTFLTYKLNDYFRTFVFEENGYSVRKARYGSFFDFTDAEQLVSVIDCESQRGFDQSENSLLLEKSLKKLSAQDLDILCRYFGIFPYTYPHTKKEIESDTGESWYLINKSINASLEFLKKEIGTLPADLI